MEHATKDCAEPHATANPACQACLAREKAREYFRTRPTPHYVCRSWRSTAGYHKRG